MSSTLITLFSFRKYDVYKSLKMVSEKTNHYPFSATVTSVLTMEQQRHSTNQ